MEVYLWLVIMILLCVMCSSVDRQCKTCKLLWRSAQWDAFSEENVYVSVCFLTSKTLSGKLKLDCKTALVAFEFAADIS